MSEIVERTSEDDADGGGGIQPSITEDVTPEEDANKPKIVSRRPLKPKQWDRRAIAVVSLLVYAVVIISVLFRLLFIGPLEDVSVSMVISTAVASFSMIVGFYFGQAK